MRDYLRSLKAHESVYAGLAMDWGYPRAIEPEEVEEGKWFRLERDQKTVAVCWFIALPKPAPDSWLAVHAIGDPKARRVEAIGSPHVLNGLKILAEVFGADRLYAPCPVASVLPHKVLRRYLSIRGWSEDELGAYVELGEGV